jgi:transposase
MDEWQGAGVWGRLHELLLAELRAAGERAFAWLHHYKRLLVRYDRRHEMHEAFLALACCLVCFTRLQPSF